MLKLTLMPCYFEMIKSGEKTVEGRVNTEKFNPIAAGELIVFINNDTKKKLICTIKAINKYKSFEAMLSAEGIENMLPGVTELNQAIQIYENLPGYKDKVKLYGAIAITIELIRIV